MKKIVDIVGIGFGPSNLALAAAIDESPTANVSAIFLERQPHFSWHKDMLLEGAEMQIAFLKDLATPRDPSSAFTFLKYVHEQGRLSQFINLKQFYLSRLEFNDYFTWAATKLKDYVRYNAVVTKVTPYHSPGIDCLQVHYSDANQVERLILAKNVVIATGGTPYIPPGINLNKDNKKIWHTSQYLGKVAPYKSCSNKAFHFAVVGRGQSAAEIAYDLYQQFPNAHISCLHRHFGYKPADESPFSNEIFDHRNVDLFYNASSSSRQALLSGYQDTNYAVVDIELIEKLYRIQYEDQALKRQRLHWHPFTAVNAVEEKQGSVNLSLKNLQDNHLFDLNVDAVILATGYQFHYPMSMLSSLEPYLIMDPSRHPKVLRHYQLATSPELKAGIYVQGCNERTHGLTETLLSINAIRAQEILQSILENQSCMNREALYDAIA